MRNNLLPLSYGLLVPANPTNLQILFSRMTSLQVTSDYVRTIRSDCMYTNNSIDTKLDLYHLWRRPPQQKCVTSRPQHVCVWERDRECVCLYLFQCHVQIFLCTGYMNRSSALSSTTTCVRVYACALVLVCVGVHMQISIHSHIYSSSTPFSTMSSANQMYTFMFSARVCVCMCVCGCVCVCACIGVPVRIFIYSYIHLHICIYTAHLHHHRRQPPRKIRIPPRSRHFARRWSPYLRGARRWLFFGCRADGIRAVSIWFCMTICDFHELTVCTRNL